MRPASEFPMVGSSGVNLTGIPGGAGADSEGLMGGGEGRVWKGGTLPTKKRVCERG